MLNHIGPTQIFGALVLVVALYYMRTWLSRHALRGWRESHPHALAWMRRYHLLIELTEVSLAAVFFLVGGAKLIGRHDMIVLFEDIGVGQWLRYLTGTLEVSGAALLLVPLLSGPSSVALGGIMVVATLIELFVLHRPPVAALACLSGHTFVAWARLSQSRGRAISAPGGASVVRTAENDGGALGLSTQERAPTPGKTLLHEPFNPWRTASLGAVLPAPFRDRYLFSQNGTDGCGQSRARRGQR